MCLLRKITVFFLIAFFILCSPVCIAAEVQEEDESTSITYSINGSTDKCIMDAQGNQYGYTGWRTLTRAKDHYGRCWEYSPANVNFGSYHYNYCYKFTDGTFMFFGVKSFL